MRRIFSDYAYGPGPRQGCWWDETCDLPEYPYLDTDVSCDVAIVGGGFTGLSAALHLAERGVDVVLLEAHHIGWGASGRNGGFCCLGGAMVDDATLDKRFGVAGRRDYRHAERDAIGTVEGLIERFDIDGDRHSQGETELAHDAKHVSELDAIARRAQENYGVDTQVLSQSQLASNGMNGPFHGAVTLGLGFALNPRKYIAGLARAAASAGVRIFTNATVGQITRHSRWTIQANHAVKADTVIIATNGYSSDDMPDWLAARYMPAQSNILVTRPLTETEIAAQGWHSDQMAFNTRSLLNYFRLMPDRRFLFGMRGGLLSSPAAEERMQRRIRADFQAMFPAWAQVETPFTWSGMVCLARNLLPFVGAVPGQAGLYAAMCYHGNGVAMGTHSGRLLADLILGQNPVPTAMAQPLKRFPFGRLRRVVMPPAYAAMALGDL